MNNKILAEKISDVLAKHYTRCWTAKEKRTGGHHLASEKLAQDMEKVLRDYNLQKERNGK